MFTAKILNEHTFRFISHCHVVPCIGIQHSASLYRVLAHLTTESTFMNQHTHRDVETKLTGEQTDDWLLACDTRRTQLNPHAHRETVNREHCTEPTHPPWNCQQRTLHWTNTPTVKLSTENTALNQHTHRETVNREHCTEPTHPPWNCQQRTLHWIHTLTMKLSTENSALNPHAHSETVNIVHIFKNMYRALSTLLWTSTYLCKEVWWQYFEDLPAFHLQCFNICQLYIILWTIKWQSLIFTLNAPSNKVRPWRLCLVEDKHSESTPGNGHIKEVSWVHQGLIAIKYPQPSKSHTWSQYFFSHNLHIFINSARIFV